MDSFEQRVGARLEEIHFFRMTRRARDRFPGTDYTYTGEEGPRRHPPGPVGIERHERKERKSRARFPFRFVGRATGKDVHPAPRAVPGR